jgi:pyruvate-formate lyase-activating enzyme
MKPHKNNFCGGNFSDWLEVYLTPKCNGNCSWCVDKNGWKPSEEVSYLELADVINNDLCKNVILLGGEPTLYPYLGRLIKRITFLGSNKNVYITTNGSMITREFVENKLIGIKGLNISIHDYNLDNHYSETGIDLSEKMLVEAISTLHANGSTVRLNCNCIKGCIDHIIKIYSYIEFAKDIGADSIRFSELKFSNERFVDLAKLFEYHYGLNDDPFTKGCNTDTNICGMHVNFRQMCGFQTSLRPTPSNPEVNVEKKVLYYDGKMYNGWQQKKDATMTPEETIISTILKQVQSGEVSVSAATKIFNTIIEQVENNRILLDKSDDTFFSVVKRDEYEKKVEENCKPCKGGLCQY